MDHTEASFQRLLDTLRNHVLVRAVGKTGGKALPQDGQSDVDLFIFCKQIPEWQTRKGMLASLGTDLAIPAFGETEHPHWGLVDSLVIGETEVCMMYFSQDAFEASVGSILSGERVQREKNYFYPTGRLASIQDMHAFYDPDGFLARLKERISVYPGALRAAVLSQSLPKIDDEEDFRRAVRRGDVPFYHATLDLAIDNFLQALFALNRVYFPSRKRSLEYIGAFTTKPERCGERLLGVIHRGGEEQTLSDSYASWHELCQELNESAKHI